MTDPNKGPSKEFTAGHVAAMIESFDGKVSAMAESVEAIREDVNVLKTDVAELKSDMVFVKDAIKVAIPDLAKRVSRLETKVGA